MLKILTDLGKSQKGATAVEYGLIVSLIVIAMLASLNVVANSTISMWGFVEDNIAAE